MTPAVAMTPAPSPPPSPLSGQRYWPATATAPGGLGCGPWSMVTDANSSSWRFSHRPLSIDALTAVAVCGATLGPVGHGSCCGHGGGAGGEALLHRSHATCDRDAPSPHPYRSALRGSIGPLFGGLGVAGYGQPSLCANGLGPFACMLGASADVEDAAAQLPGFGGWPKAAGVQQLASNQAAFNSCQANRFVNNSMLTAHWFLPHWRPSVLIRWSRRRKGSLRRPARCEQQPRHRARSRRSTT
ncbi:hypothetical protein PLESTF_001544000 [Pleodorina starrii]|nr:hypothetical protein PLESTF_001544000 [Pleodorina starrii]